MIFQLLRLTRPWYSVPVSAGMIVICLYLANGYIDGAWSRVLAGCGALCMVMSATYCLNDFIDLPIDRVNRPDRPIPSGMVKSQFAIGAAIALYAGGIMTAAWCGLGYAAGITATAIAAVLYNIYAKRAGWFKDIWSGALMCSVYPLSLLLVSIVPGRRADSLWFSASWFFLTCTAFAMFKDVCDSAGDMRHEPTGIAAYSGRRGFLNAARGMVTLAGVIPLVIWVLGMCDLVFGITSILTLILAVAAGFSRPRIAIRIIYAEVAVFTAGAAIDITHEWCW